MDLVTESLGELWDLWNDGIRDVLTLRELRNKFGGQTLLQLVLEDGGSDGYSPRLQKYPGLCMLSDQPHSYEECKFY